MSSAITIVAAFVALAPGVAEIRAQGAAASAIYLVTRSNSAESRALLSGRLLALNAANLRWLDGGNVVRAEAPAESVARFAADPDVVLVLRDDELANGACASNATSLQAPAMLTPPMTSGLGTGSALARMLGTVLSGMMTGGSSGLVTAGAVPGLSGQPGLGAQTPAFLPGAPATFSGGALGSPFPAGGFGGPVAMMSGSAGLMDSLAGGLVSHLFNRPPACKISVKEPETTIAADGGDAVVHVKASGLCTWQAQASVPWITITSGSGSSGSGIVSYTVAPDAPKGRSGSISITAAGSGAPVRGNATIVVRQDPPEKEKAGIPQGRRPNS